MKCRSRKLLRRIGLLREPGVKDSAGVDPASVVAVAAVPVAVERSRRRLIGFGRALQQDDLKCRRLTGHRSWARAGFVGRAEGCWWFQVNPRRRRS